MAIQLYIPELPKYLIERILDEADLPYEVRIEFIHQFKVTPKRLPYDLDIEQDLYFIHKSRVEKYKCFMEYKKVPYNKRTYLRKPVLEDLYGSDHEVIFTEQNGEIIYSISRLILDVSDYSLAVINKVLSNAHTGKLIEQYYDKNQQ
jgi:hypothetical protein